MTAPPPQWQDGLEYDEQELVFRRRTREALDAGLTLKQAERFARSTQDIGTLRKLVHDGCPAKTIARIVT